MRTLRMSLLGTVILALLGGLGSVAGAQSESDEAMPDPAVVVSGTGACTLADVGTSSVEPGGILRERDVIVDCTVTSNDPRLGGDSTVTMNVDCYLTTDGTVQCVYFGTDTGAGGWDCTWTGTPDPTGMDYILLLAVCSGTGENAGLAYVGHRAMLFGDDVPDFGGGASHRGLVYEGDPPPMPEPPAE